nr:hypothetical protein [Marseillevirus cajuinensis]
MDASNWKFERQFCPEEKPQTPTELGQCRNENSMVPLLRLKTPPKDQTLQEYFGLVQRDLPWYSDVDAFGTPKINGCNFLALSTQVPDLALFPRSPYMNYGNPRGITGQELVGVAQRSGEQYLSTSTRTGKQVFRSKHRGICPLGWVSGPNGLCLPENTAQRDGMFYNVPNVSALYSFSNCGIQQCMGATQ